MYNVHTYRLYSLYNFCLTGVSKKVSKRILMVSSNSVDAWDLTSDEWIPEEKQRMPTAMHGFDAITVKIEDFCGP